MFSNLSSVFLLWAPSGRKARNIYTCSPANTRARWPLTNHAQWSPLYLCHPRRHSTDGSRLDAISCHSTHTIRSTTQSTDDHPTEGSAAGYLFASLYFRLPLTRLHSNKTGDPVKHGMVGVLCMRELAQDSARNVNNGKISNPSNPGFQQQITPAFRGW